MITRNFFFVSIFYIHYVCICIFLGGGGGQQQCNFILAFKLMYFLRKPKQL